MRELEDQLDPLPRQNPSRKKEARGKTVSGAPLVGEIVKEIGQKIELNVSHASWMEWSFFMRGKQEKIGTHREKNT